MAARAFRSALLPLPISLPGVDSKMSPARREIRTEANVDLARFMGDWYVIACIPTFLQKDAYNAKERYELASDGSIETTFSYRKGGLDGESRQYNLRGFVRDKTSNAIWGMRFLWPVISDYRIVYLNEDYSQTIIGREKRDFVWLMARTPSIAHEDFFRRAQLIRAQGYDISRLKVVPQQWDVEPRWREAASLA